ncbi:unnamed protein product [Sympodiomycopsis kandeliae]
MRASSSSAAASKADPNHPQNLDIKPSSDRRKGKQKADCDSRTELARSNEHHTDAKQHELWEVDTADDIEQWGIAGRIWEAAYLFRQYLKPADPDVGFDPPCPLFLSGKGDFGKAGRNILELGSGVGYVGIACAQELRSQEARLSTIPSSSKNTLVLTDLDNVCDLMTRNAKAAGFSGELNCDKTTQIFVRPLPWGSSVHAKTILREFERENEANSLDLILCSDLVYFPELLAPLLRSLIHLTDSHGSSDQSPTVLIAYKIRSLSKEQPFWDNLGIWFEVETVNCRYRRTPQASEENSARIFWGNWHRFGSFKSDLDGTSRDDEEDSEDEYFIFVAKRKESTYMYTAPEQDEKLMSGFMRPRESPESDLIRGRGGAEYLEWALMGSLCP